MNAGSRSRVFLFLQGPSSPLFAKIADRLDALGHRCLRINLNAGDSIFWRRKGAHHYRGKGGETWRDYVGTFLERHKVTDLILLGEERPYHQIAIQAARERAVDVVVVEMGYLRPDWLTLERDGMSSNSHFPNDPRHILQAAEGLAEPDWTRRYSQSFIAEAAYDLLYNLPNVFFWFLFPHYRRHALFHPLAEYAGWLRRLVGDKRRSRDAERLIARLRSQDTPFFIVPLQLQTDYQLRSHSPYRDQRDAIREILASFARYAPPSTLLVFKIHPLDNGLIDWEGYIAKLTKRLGIGGRVAFLDGGNLTALLEKSAGVVTVNSTVGLQALQLQKPVKVLGAAIFDISGLSSDARLDDFWGAPIPPDIELQSAFLRLLAASIQVRGNFYSQAGTDAGAAAIAGRLHERSVNEPGGYIDPPARKKPSKIEVPGY